MMTGHFCAEKLKVFAYLMVLALLLGLGGEAAAKGRRGAKKVKKVRVALLPMQVKGVAELEVKTLPAVVFEQLRSIGVFRPWPLGKTNRKVKWMQGKKIYSLQCTAQAPCVRKVGKRLRAGVLFRLDLRRQTEGVSVTLASFDVGSGELIKESSELTTGTQEEMERAVSRLTRLVSGPMVRTLAQGKGRLQVLCDEADADLYLNGKNFGKRTGKSFKVSAGVFDVIVKKEEFSSYREVVVVLPGLEQVVIAHLDAEVAKPPEPATEKNPEQELPAWAVFEKKSAAKESVSPPPKPAAEAKVLASVDQTPEPEVPSVPEVEPVPELATQAFLPDAKQEPTAPADLTDFGQERFYQTWWFWSLVGTGVAGAAGATAFFLLKEEQTDAGLGSALVTWN